eukprot:12213160-Prorocentrum_lima.AAC.1
MRPSRRPCVSLRMRMHGLTYMGLQMRVSQWLMRRVLCTCLRRTIRWVRRVSLKLMFRCLMRVAPPGQEPPRV